MRLPDYITDWPPEWKELWSERAGIMEHDSNISRASAERLAEADIRKQAANADWESVT